jgi:hypothetical protein
LNAEISRRFGWNRTNETESMTFRKITRVEGRNSGFRMERTGANVNFTITLGRKGRTGKTDNGC